MKHTLLITVVLFCCLQSQAFSFGTIKEYSTNRAAKKEQEYTKALNTIIEQLKSEYPNPISELKLDNQQFTLEATSKQSFTVVSTMRVTKDVRITVKVFNPETRNYEDQRVTVSKEVRFIKDVTTYLVISIYFASPDTLAIQMISEDKAQDTLDLILADYNTQVIRTAKNILKCNQLSNKTDTSKNNKASLNRCLGGVSYRKSKLADALTNLKKNQKDLMRHFNTVYISAPNGAKNLRNDILTSEKDLHLGVVEFHKKSPASGSFVFGYTPYDWKPEYENICDLATVTCSCSWKESLYRELHSRTCTYTDKMGNFSDTSNIRNFFLYTEESLLSIRSSEDIRLNPDGTISERQN